MQLPMHETVTTACRTCAVLAIAVLVGFALAQTHVDFGEIQARLMGFQTDSYMSVTCTDALDVEGALEALQTRPSREWATKDTAIVCRYAHVSGEPSYSPFDGLTWRYTSPAGLLHDVRDPLRLMYQDAPISFEIDLFGDPGKLLPGGHFSTLLYLHDAERPGDVLLCLWDTCRDFSFVER